MRSKFFICLPGLLLASACSDSAAPPVVFDTEGWIDTAPAMPPGPKPLLSAWEDGEDDEDEGDEGEEGFEARFGIFGPYADGQLSSPEGEFYAGENGQDLCQIFYEVSLVGSIPPCDGCTAAYELSIGAAEVDTNANGACETYNGASLAGTTLRLGFIEGGALFREGNEGWQPIGDAGVEEGELWMGWDWDA